MATTTQAKKTTTKKTTAKKTTAKTATKQTTESAATKAKRASTTSASTAAKRTTRQKATPLHEREPRTIAIDAGYAAAGIANEVLTLVKELPTKVERAKTSRGELRGKANGQRATFETQIRQLRDSFEKGFDERAQAGRKVTEELTQDERFAAVEAQLKKALEQADVARSQIKAAVTSVRRTGDVAGDAATDQAGNAKSQVKAATTSVKKTVELLVEAGTKLVR